MHNFAGFQPHTTNPTLPKISLDPKPTNPKPNQLTETKT